MLNGITTNAENFMEPLQREIYEKERLREEGYIALDFEELARAVE
jgi:hypothetical protein